MIFVLTCGVLDERVPIIKLITYVSEVFWSPVKGLDYKFDTQNQLHMKQF